MSGFDDLEGQLLDAVERRGSRRSPRAAAYVVLASSSLVAALAVFAIVLLGHGKPPSSSPTRTPPASASPAASASPESSSEAFGGMQILFKFPPGSQSEMRSASAALLGVESKDSACAPVQRSNPTGAAISQGAPSAALLSALAVLRRHATAADRLPAPLYYAGRPVLLGDPNVAYVRYIRRARVVNGVAYYLIPGVTGSAAPTQRVLNRCYAEEMRALRSRLAHATKSSSAMTLSYGARAFAANRAAIARQRPFEGVVELDWRLRGGGGGGGGGDASAAEIEQQGMTGGTGSALYGVVPSGVATVTLEWPAGAGAQPRTVTTDVINNMFVVNTPSGGGLAPYQAKMIWRAADGHVIKTVNSSG